MSCKQTFDKTMTALENSKEKMCDFYSYLKSLSIKSKANFDCQLKSTKKHSPLWRFGFDYDKEARLLPIIYAVLAAILIWACACSCKNCSDD